MKTTLDLPDELLMAAKTVAVQRRTTLKDLVTRSLRREIGLDEMPLVTPESPYEIGELGLPVLKKRGAAIADGIIHQLIQSADEEDLRDALKTAGQS